MPSRTATALLLAVALFACGAADKEKAGEKAGEKAKAGESPRRRSAPRHQSPHVAGPYAKAGHRCHHVPRVTGLRPLVGRPAARRLPAEAAQSSVTWAVPTTVRRASRRGGQGVSGRRLPRRGKTTYGFRPSGRAVPCRGSAVHPEVLERGSSHGWQDLSAIGWNAHLHGCGGDCVGRRGGWPSASSTGLLRPGLLRSVLFGPGVLRAGAVCTSV